MEVIESFRGDPSALDVDILVVVLEWISMRFEVSYSSSSRSTILGEDFAGGGDCLFTTYEIHERFTIG